MLAGIPLFAGGLGNLLAGRIMPIVAARLGVQTARRVLPIGGFALAAFTLFFIARNLDEPLIVMGAMGLASFFGDLCMPCAWGACMDVGGRFSGTYSGSMNMMGNLGGAAGPVVVGYLLKATDQNWGIVYDLSGAALLVGAVCWLFIDPVTPLEHADERPVGPGA